MKGEMKRALVVNCYNCFRILILDIQSIKMGRQEAIEKGWGFNSNPHTGWICPNCKKFVEKKQKKNQ